MTARSQDTLPDFIILGAMKCGTSTMAAQLGAQPGLFMTDPKEPNFFSDDPVFARGMGWYQNLFADAAPDDLKGEASTHYTKLPTYPETLARMSQVLTAPRLVYMIRDPLARAVSHYIHEWTMGVITDPLDAALDSHPELISYGCYARQIAPYVDHYGAENILVLSLEDMDRAPQDSLQRVCDFIGYTAPPVWIEEKARTNASSERIRRLPLHGLLIDNVIAQTLRRALVPQALRDRIRQSRQMTRRPTLSPSNVARLQQVFAEDHAHLRRLFPDRPDLDICYPFVAS